MAQAIVCYNREGLIVAADSLILQEGPGGQVTRWTGRRLFALGARAVLLAAGAPVAAELGAELASWLQARGLVELEDVAAVSRDFMSEGYARHLRGIASTEAAPRHLHFVIAGCTGECAPEESRVLLLQSEAGELPFQELRPGRVFALPRRLALERRIGRQIAEGAALEGLAASCLQGLADVAARNPESVAGPYQAAMVTAAGVRFLDEVS